MGAKESFCGNLAAIKQTLEHQHAQCCLYLGEAHIDRHTCMQARWLANKVMHRSWQEPLQNTWHIGLTA
jgi:hypothetical protein